MAYSKQTWDTTSYVNPTRMNHIEDGIESASTAVENTRVVVSDRLSSSTGWSSTIAFPTGFTMSNTYVLTLLVADANGWRVASEGLTAGGGERLFPEINGSGVRVYNNIDAYYGATFKMVLAKI